MKKIKNYSLLFLLVILFSNVGISQLKQRVADRMYSELEYINAVELYEEIAKKESDNYHVIQRAADCYSKLDNTLKAEEFYSMLMSANPTVEDMFEYALVLKQNKKYEAAQKQFAKVLEKKSDHSSAKSHLEKMDYYNSLRNSGSKHIVKIMDKVNTNTSDFGTNYLKKDGQKKLVFSSGRSVNGMVNQKFGWDKSNFLDIFEAELNADGSSTNIEKFDNKINSKYHDGPVSFSNNGDVMYLSRSNYINKKIGKSSEMVVNIKLYIAKRNPDGSWSDLKEFPHNSDQYSVGHATVTEDGKKMYFVSDMEGTKGKTDIWTSTYDGATWSKPENLASLNTEGKEMFPYIVENGNLYFSSEGHAGLGGLDVFRAMKSGDEFRTPTNLGYPLNTEYDDFALISDEKEKLGYFSSNRKYEGAVGNDDIYHITLDGLDNFVVVNGCVLNEEDGTKVPNSEVSLINEETNEIVGQVYANESGCYTFTDVPNGKYRISASHDEFKKGKDFRFDTEGLDEPQVNDANPTLKKAQCGLEGTVVDDKGSPISNATIKLRDKNTGEMFFYQTDNSGQFLDPLSAYDCPGGTINYQVQIQKDGYSPKDESFTELIVNEGTVEKKWTLIKVGTDISQLCDINEIKYDLNRFNIRSDAALELDKLVSCMQSNPEINVEIGAHTDCRGSDAYNASLSDKRAIACRNYVISKGISPNRIFGKGYGETRFKVNCSCNQCSDSQHQENRRTEFRVIGNNNIRNNSSNSFDR